MKCLSFGAWARIIWRLGPCHATVNPALTCCFGLAQHLPCPLGCTRCSLAAQRSSACTCCFSQRSPCRIFGKSAGGTAERLCIRHSTRRLHPTPAGCQRGPGRQFHAITAKAPACRCLIAGIDCWRRTAGTYRARLVAQRAVGQGARAGQAPAALHEEAGLACRACLQQRASPGMLRRAAAGLEQSEPRKRHGRPCQLPRGRHASQPTAALLPLRHALGQLEGAARATAGHQLLQPAGGPRRPTRLARHPPACAPPTWPVELQVVQFGSVQAAADTTPCKNSRARGFIGRPLVTAAGWCARAAGCPWCAATPPAGRRASAPGHRQATGSPWRRPRRELGSVPRLQARRPAERVKRFRKNSCGFSVHVQPRASTRRPSHDGPRLTSSTPREAQEDQAKLQSSR